MTRDEHLLTIAAEECAEVAQRCAKALRFGLSQVQHAPDDKPEQNPELLNNLERIRREYVDLTAVLTMIDSGLTRMTETELRAKRAKVNRYLEMSLGLGTLTYKDRMDDAKAGFDI